MKHLLSIMVMILLGIPVMAQTKPVPGTPPAVVSVIEGVSGSDFCLTPLTQLCRTKMKR